MSGAKHTPGPWEVLDGTRVGVTLPSLTEGCGYDSHCIALTYGHDQRIDARANARLIAAAPELLEALRNYVDGCSLSIDALAVARAAIAKATGGAL